MIERLRASLADRYRLERELGAGGMATVYLAHDLKHERDVAIKVLHPDLGAALGAERFLTEIRTTARLQHPHILPLLDSGSVSLPHPERSEGSPALLYYVMPLVTGETLRARLERERQLPIDDAVLIAREVADALGYAHGLGVIHRDIKPENILLQGGHALVADFGIALAVQSSPPTGSPPRATSRGRCRGRATRQHSTDTCSPVRRQHPRIDGFRGARPQPGPSPRARWRCWSRGGSSPVRHRRPR
jgi:serine/threonine-protein kinase